MFDAAPLISLCWSHSGRGREPSPSSVPAEDMGALVVSGDSGMQLRDAGRAGDRQGHVRTAGVKTPRKMHT